LKILHVSTLLFGSMTMVPTIPADRGVHKPAGGSTEHIYVSDQEGSRVIAIDLETDQIGKEIKVPQAPAAMTKSKHKIFVTHPDSGEISVIDTVTDSVVGTYAVSGVPFGIVGLGDDSFAFSDWKSGLVSRYNLSTAEVSEQIYVGHSPANMVYDERHKKIYVALREDDSIAVINAETFVLEAKASVGQAPFALTLNQDGDRLFVGNVRSGTVSVVKANDLSSTQSFKAGISPYGLAMSPDKEDLLVVDQEDNSLRVFDSVSFQQKDRIAVGRFPEGVAVNAHLNQAYVTNWFSGDVAVVNLQTKELKTMIKVGGSPRAVIVMEAH